MKRSPRLMYWERSFSIRLPLAAEIAVFERCVPSMVRRIQESRPMFFLIRKPKSVFSPTTLCPLSCVCWWLSVGVTCPTRTRGRRETCQTFPLLLELLLGSPYGALRCLMSLALKEIRRVEGPMRFPGRAEVGFVANFSEDMESLIGKEDISLDVTSSAEPNYIIAGVASSSSTSSLRSTFAQIFLADRVVQSRP